MLLNGWKGHKFSKMKVTLIFTNGLKTQTRMLLDASAGGSMKNKTTAEIQELIDSMSLNEYRPQGSDRNVAKNREVLKLESQDALLESQRMLGEKMEEIVKKLEAKEVAKLSTNGLGRDFCDQAHETRACLPESLGLSEEQVKFMRVVTRQQSYPFSNNCLANCSNFFLGGNSGFQTSQATNLQHPMKALKETLEQYMKLTQSRIESLSKSQEESRRNTEASIKDLKIQIGKISTQITSFEKLKSEE
jgi:hypothetical protein